MDNYVKGVKVIEIYDAANKELLVKYDDKHNIDSPRKERKGNKVLLVELTYRFLIS